MKIIEYEFYKFLDQNHGSIERNTPEAVIYEFASLLVKDNAQLGNLLPGRSMPYIEEARTWFEKKRLDYSLIKASLPLVAKAAPEDENRNVCLSRFMHYLEADRTFSVSELLDCADEMSFIDIAGVFNEDCTMENIYSYYFKMSARLSNLEDSDQFEKEEIPSIEDIDVGDEETEMNVDYVEDLFDEDSVDQMPDISLLSREIQRLKAELKKEVIGQDIALDQIIDGLMDVLSAASPRKRNAPAGVFFLAGPPGVGKTMTSRLVAKCLHRNCKLFDMTAYASESDHFQLTGTDRSYKNGHEGYMTEEIKKDPRSVIILDEIEKSSTTMQNVFLNILGSGEYTDEYSKERVDCRNTIMIFTSNAGKLLYEGNDNFASLPKAVLMDALSKETKTNSRGDREPVISAPLLSRLMSNNVIMFGNIGISELEGIASRQMKMLCKDYLGLNIILDEKMPLLFLYNSGNNLDARIAASKSPAFVKHGMKEAMRQVGNRPDLFDNVKQVEFTVDVPDDKEIGSYFSPNEKCEMYVVCEEELKEKIRQSGDNYNIVFGTGSVNEIPERKLFDVIIVDPFTGMTENASRFIGLEDRDIPGVNLIKDIIKERMNIPIYLLSSKKNPISQTDEESFINNGVKGVLRQESDEGMASDFSELARRIQLLSQYKKLSKRGYILDYDLVVERAGGSDKIIIRYCNLRKKQAIDSATGHAALTDNERPKVTFDDVIGAEHAKEELRYYIDYLKDPTKHIKKGDAPAKGILMYGPPGTGKTLLARAVAGESDCTFFQLNASEFIMGKVGAGEEAVRELFAKARKYAPSIIFIDEIDSIGKTRFDQMGPSPNHSILTTLFTEMDGFDTHSGDPVFVLAATNYGVRGENSLQLDPGLERRFNVKIYVELPRKEDRKRYLEYVCNKKGYSQITEDGIVNLADRTMGRSLAEMEQIVDLMHRKAIRMGKTESDDLLADSLDEYMHGREKKHDNEYYKKTAVHEAGHVYMCWKGGAIPSFVTIVSRENYGGYMTRGDDEERGNYSASELREIIRTSLAGRIAEEEFFGPEALNTGASSDLEKASGIALDIVSRYGMDGENFAFTDSHWMQSPLATSYVERAKVIVSEETENCRKAVHEGREVIKRIADRLEENSFLTREQLKELLSNE